ncbi:uncharacterized protein LOC131679875 [Topomyia yanbarensis]|uniref:uncharacterized protein LOC131679875 n=1 Tax=Topomyia yanbarensis TaxID=2498891 RepID=UPI00273CBA26|nr:uncharacterized protein LOC131679875 [Topomyia yanbarensis]
MEGSKSENDIAIPNPATAANSQEIKKHVFTCNRARDALERMHKFIDSFEPSRLAEAQLRLARLDQIYTTYQDSSSALEILTDGIVTEYEMDLQKDLEEFENDFFALQAWLKTHCSSQAERLPDTTPGTTCGTLRLPSISVPEFNGDIDKWYSFYDTFRSLIHNNPELSDIQKFHYFKASLKGTAAKLIDDITLCADNYTVALKIITDRFEHPKVLIKSHLNALFAIQKVQTESAQSLSNLLDDFQKNIGVLNKLGEPTSDWSSLLVHMLTSRLDPATKREWERTTDPKSMPKFEELVYFLQNHILQLQSLEVDFQRNAKSQTTRATYATTSSSNRSCSLCSGNHSLFYCGKFKALTVPERINVVSSKGLCANCISERHHPNQCKQRSCRVCGKKHNSLLHRSSPHNAKGTSTLSNQQEPTNISQSLEAPNESAHSRSLQIPSTSQSSFVTSRSNRSPQVQVFLSTALVKVVGPKGNIAVARVLLDNASQPNLMTERFRQILNLRKSSASTELYGVGAERKVVAFSTVATVCSRFNNYRAVLEFLVLPKVTTDLPTSSVDTTGWIIPDHIQLADPTFATSGAIDMVIGSEVFFDLLRRGHMRIDDDKPTLHNSVFGWLVAGAHRSSSAPVCLVTHVITTESLNKQVAKFWEIESCQSESIWSVEERLCEEIFTSTTERDSDGRYIVTLPKRIEFIGHLGDSRSIATKRFHAMERRLAKDSALHHQYCSFMNEYLSLGHMKLVDVVSDLPGQHYYLPHHAIIKPESTTTKLRVVFDGSCRTTSGFALNDLLLKGPTVQDDMLSLIFRFRMKPIVIKADIQKMYRQIKIAEKDLPYQQILWRNAPEEPLHTYQLTTVTYGTTTAPFLATRCLQQLSDDEAVNFPAAARVVKKGFYVDDLLYGFDTLKEALEATEQLHLMMSSAGLSLRKWSSNCRNVLNEIPRDYWETERVLELDSSAPVQALGLLWEPMSDDFLFKIPQWTKQTFSTKPSVLSQTASLFDPLGLVGPVIVIAKIFIQALWELNLEWDQHLPSELHEQWMNFVSRLPILKQLRIPRFVLTDNIVRVCRCISTSIWCMRVLQSCVCIGWCIDTSHDCKISCCSSGTKTTYASSVGAVCSSPSGQSTEKGARKCGSALPMLFLVGFHDRPTLASKGTVNMENLRK